MRSSKPLEMEGPTRRKRWITGSSISSSPIYSLDEGCLMHIFSRLNPIPDRHNTALVCRRWYYLACHPRLWLRVEQCNKDSTEHGVFPNLESAITAAKPGDTILISAGSEHAACNVQINKPLCLVGGGKLPDDTVLTCARGFESALEFLSTCKVMNLTVRAELGCCFLHRSGRLIVEGCVLQCEENPLDYLSFPIISTASGELPMKAAAAANADFVKVSGTRIEGGARAVRTSGGLVLQRVRAMYARRAILFWFEVGEGDTELVHNSCRLDANSFNLC